MRHGDTRISSSSFLDAWLDRACRFLVCMINGSPKGATYNERGNMCKMVQAVATALVTISVQDTCNCGLLVCDGRRTVSDVPPEPPSHPAEWKTSNGSVKR